MMVFLLVAIKYPYHKWYIISLISSACFIPKALFHNCCRLIVNLSLQYVSVVLHHGDDDDVVLVGVFAGVIMVLYAKLLLTLKIMHRSSINASSTLLVSWMLVAQTIPMKVFHWLVSSLMNGAIVLCRLRYCRTQWPKWHTRLTTSSYVGIGTHRSEWVGQVVPLLQNCGATAFIIATKARGPHKSCATQFDKNGRVCPTFWPRGTTPVRRNSTIVPKFRIM